MIADCPELDEQRELLRGALAPLTLQSREDFDFALDQPRGARTIARWMLRSGRMPLYAKAVAWARGESF